MFDWVDIMENKLDSMSPVGTDLETVKQQIVELKVPVQDVTNGFSYMLKKFFISAVVYSFTVFTDSAALSCTSCV